MTNQETLELALNALKCLFGLPDKFTGEGGDVAVWRLGGSYRAQEAIKALEEALAKQEQGEPVAWTENDMAYRPNGLPQEFIHHEVESPDDWSEWVCPKPEQYFLKCCDCGLVHEAQFRVAKYGEGDYCELVEDKDTQAQFRMRRRTTPQQRKPLTNGEIYTAYITATNQTLRAQDERLALAFARAIEAAHGIKENT
jgi:hypothetical protein